MLTRTVSSFLGTNHVKYGFQIQRRFHGLSFPSVPSDACSFKACLHRLCNLFATGSRLKKN